MKANKKFTVVIAAVLLVSMLTLAVSAYSNSFSIPTNSTSWNAKDNGVLWGFDNGATATWQLVNTSAGDRNLSGQLKYVIKLWPDADVGFPLSVNGGYGASNTATFVPYTDRGYYPVITTNTTDGVTGTVSAWQ